MSAALNEAAVAADERLANREREWRADAARTLDSAVREARATAETEAAVALAAEQGRWAADADQTVAAAVAQETEALTAALKQARGAADERPADRERQATVDAEPATEEQLDVGALDGAGEVEDAAGKAAMEAWDAEDAEAASAPPRASSWKRLLRR